MSNGCNLVKQWQLVGTMASGVVLTVKWHLVDVIVEGAKCLAPLLDRSRQATGHYCPYCHHG